MTLYLKTAFGDSSTLEPTQGENNLRALVGILEFYSSFFKVVIYLNRRLIPGTSEHFDRFFEMSSSPDATASKPKTQNTIVMVMHQESIMFQH